MALVTIAQAAFSANQATAAQNAAKKAERQGLDNEIAGQNKQLALSMKRKTEGGTVLGGSSGGGSVANQGTILTSTNTKPSLLG